MVYEDFEGLRSDLFLLRNVTIFRIGLDLIKWELVGSRRMIRMQVDLVGGCKWEKIGF